MPGVVYGVDGTGIAPRKMMCFCCKKQIEIGDRVTRTRGSDPRCVHALCRPVYWYDDGLNRYLLPTNTAYSEFNSRQHLTASNDPKWDGVEYPSHLDWVYQSVVIEEAIAKLQRKWKAWKKRWEEEVDGAVVALMVIQRGAKYKWQQKHLMYMVTENIILNIHLR